MSCSSVPAAAMRWCRAGTSRQCSSGSVRRIHPPRREIPHRPSPQHPDGPPTWGRQRTSGSTLGPTCETTSNISTELCSGRYCKLKQSRVPWLPASVDLHQPVHFKWIRWSCQPVWQQLTSCIGGDYTLQNLPDGPQECGIACSFAICLWPIKDWDS